MTAGYAARDIEFEDEMRVGTRTALGRRYAPCGTRPVGRQRIGYEYLYLYVSIKPMTGEVFACFLPRLDKVCLRLIYQGAKQTTDTPDSIDCGRSGSASARRRKSVVKAGETTRLFAGIESGGAFFSGVATQVEVSRV